MIFSVDREEVDIGDLGFDPDSLGEIVCKKVLEVTGCPFETQTELLITDDEGIRELNSNMRGIDAPTDVLSFPGLVFDEPAVFDTDLNKKEDITDNDTGCVMLGDIVINIDRVRSQAKEYGHSMKREYAFLLAHAMLHLCGYDHMEDDERLVMENMQERIMQELNISRD